MIIIEPRDGRGGAADVKLHLFTLIRKIVSPRRVCVPEENKNRWGSVPVDVRL